MEKEPCISPRELVIIREHCRVAKAPVSPGGTLLCKLQHRGILPVGLAGTGLLFKAHGAASAVPRTWPARVLKWDKREDYRSKSFLGSRRKQMCFIVLHWINDGFSLLQKHFNIAGYLGYFQIFLFVDIAATNILIYKFSLYHWTVFLEMSFWFKRYGHFAKYCYFHLLEAHYLENTCNKIAGLPTL